MDFTARRIVSLQPSASVILSSIGALDRLVGCTKYCEEVIPGISEGRFIVADSWTSKADEILAARPDLVIASVPYQVEALTQILKCGVRFLGLAPKSLADIYADIAAISSIVGLGAEGERVIATMEETIREVRARVEHGHRGLRPRDGWRSWWKLRVVSSWESPENKPQQKQSTRLIPRFSSQPGAVRAIVFRWRKLSGIAAGVRCGQCASARCTAYLTRS